MNDLVEKEISPDNMIALAIKSGASIDQLERFLAMKERYDASEAKNAFVKSMSEFRSKCVSIEKTKKGHNCMYAGLAETIEQISPALIKCGLSHRWETKQENNQITVTCFLTHENGHSESSTMSSSPDNSGNKNSIQAIGSTISYLQRYTLYSVCGLASRDVDDDGHSANTVYISDEQANILHAIANDNGLLERTLKWLRSKGINSIEEIPENVYNDIYSTVKGQIKR